MSLEYEHNHRIPGEGGMGYGRKSVTHPGAVVVVGSRAPPAVTAVLGTDGLVDVADSAISLLNVIRGLAAFRFFLAPRQRY